MHKGISMKRAINRGGGQNKLNFPFILKLKQQFQRFRLKKRLNSRLLHYVQKLTPPLSYKNRYSSIRPL